MVETGHPHKPSISGARRCAVRQSRQRRPAAIQASPVSAGILTIEGARAEARVDPLLQRKRAGCNDRPVPVLLAMLTTSAAVRP